MTPSGVTAVCRKARAFIAAGILVVTFAGSVHGQDDHHRWTIKTSVIGGALDLTPRRPRFSTVFNLAHPRPDIRRNEFLSELIPRGAGASYQEGDIVELRGWIHLVGHEEDGDFHIQLTDDPDDGDNHVVLEIPDPAEIYDQDLRARVQESRDWIIQELFKGRRGPSKSGSCMVHPVYVRVVGQLFFDSWHVPEARTGTRGRKGMKSTAIWELHPVISIEHARKPDRVRYREGIARGACRPAQH